MPPANTIAEATPPHATRSSGPIQPRFTARTKKKTTPSSVTTPPAKANAFAPIRPAAESVRPQSNEGVRGAEAGRPREGGGNTGAGAGSAWCGGAGAGLGAGRALTGSSVATPRSSCWIRRLNDAAPTTPRVVGSAGMHRSLVDAVRRGNRASQGPTSGLAPVRNGRPGASHTAMRKALLIAVVALVAGCGGTSEPRRVPNVRYERLDVAEARLDARGIGWEEVGGGTFGVILRSNWYVSEQIPKPGVKATTVRLVVERCDDD